MDEDLEEAIERVGKRAEDLKGWPAERVISTHDHVAEFQQHRGRPDHAAQARARADRDRDLLEQARAELAKDETDAPQDPSS
jgi:hypothetical protein